MKSQTKAEQPTLLSVVDSLHAIQCNLYQLRRWVVDGIEDDDFKAATTAAWMMDGYLDELKGVAEKIYTDFTQQVQS